MVQASAEKLEHTGPAEKKRVVSMPQREQLGKYTRAALAKRKVNRAPDRERGESQGEREPYLGKKERDQSESIERKGWTLQ